METPDGVPTFKYDQVDPAAIEKERMRVSEEQHDEYVASQHDQLAGSGESLPPPLVNIGYVGVTIEDHPVDNGLDYDSQPWGIIRFWNSDETDGTDLREFDTGVGRGWEWEESQRAIRTEQNRQWQEAYDRMYNINRRNGRKESDQQLSLEIQHFLMEEGYHRWDEFGEEMMPSGMHDNLTPQNRRPGARPPKPSATERPVSIPRGGEI